MLNSEFNELLGENFSVINLYPTELKDKIDEINGLVYDSINNGSEYAFRDLFHNFNFFPKSFLSNAPMTQRSFSIHSMI